VSDRDDRFLAQLARRNWVFLGLLTLASLAWRSIPITQGVVAGGLVAIIGFGWLQRSLVKVLMQGGEQASKRFRSGFYLRLAALVLVLFFMITRAAVQPIALLVGLSVVVINITWTTFRRIY